MIQVLLVDDHPMVGEGTKIILEKENKIKVTFETSATKVLERVSSEVFDVLIFDLQMPELNGIELTKKVLKVNPNLNILIYTGFDIIPQLALILESGAVGFVSKTATKDQLITAIHCAINQEAVIPISLLKAIYNRKNHSIKDKAEVGEVSFSNRERTILQYLAKGKTNKEMAQSLFIGQRSLEYALTSIFKKLNVQTRVEAVFKAKELGLTDFLDDSLL